MTDRTRAGRGRAGAPRAVLWISDLGSVNCIRHLPDIVARALERRPAAQQLTGDSTSWHRLSSTDIDSLRAMSEHDVTCERCAIAAR